MPEEDARLLKSQRKELSSIIGIGKSGISDISRRHDQYIYEGHYLKIQSVDKKLHRGLPLWLLPPFGVILLRNTPGVTLAW